jgi:hypothetical protein
LGLGFFTPYNFHFTNEYIKDINMAMTQDRYEISKDNLMLHDAPNLTGYSDWKAYTEYWEARIKKGWVVVDGFLLNPKTRVSSRKRAVDNRMKNDPSYAARVKHHNNRQTVE